MYVRIGNKQVKFYVKIPTGCPKMAKMGDTFLLHPVVQVAISQTRACAVVSKLNCMPTPDK